MKIYLAPLQGLTDWIYRESFYEHIGHFDKSFSPFIRVEKGDFFRPSQCKDINPEHNRFQKPVPQFLGNDAESFARFEELCHKHGYTEANINLGCPFTKVSNRGLGSGLLNQPLIVDELLHAIFSSSKLQLSVKCRLGQENASEFDTLIPIFNRYPITEMIIHARVGAQLYKGDVQKDAFSQIVPKLSAPVFYNGDLTSIEDVQSIAQLAPTIAGIMIGRGAVSNPFLLSDLRGETLNRNQKIEKLRKFHHAMVLRCKDKYSGDLSVIKRFEELWELHSTIFEDGRKILKQVKKSKTVAQYETGIDSALQRLL